VLGVSGTMTQSQLFTPPQLLEAGQRAEQDGRLDLAVQFYRHLIDQYGISPEATEGRKGLGRVVMSDPQMVQPQIWRSNGAATTNGAARPQRRRPVAPRNHYRIGRALARLISTAGWLAAVFGLMAPLAYWLLDRFAAASALPRPGLALVAVGAVGLVATGLLVVLAGHLARAIFDQANAMRDLVALERAKIGSD
jgi:hypothetical protein